MFKRVHLECKHDLTPKEFEQYVSECLQKKDFKIEAICILDEIRSIENRELPIVPKRLDKLLQLHVSTGNDYGIHKYKVWCSANLDKGERNISKKIITKWKEPLSELRYNYSLNYLYNLIHYHSLANLYEPLDRMVRYLLSDAELDHDLWFYDINIQSHKIDVRFMYNLGEWKNADEFIPFFSIIKRPNVLYPSLFLHSITVKCPYCNWRIHVHAIDYKYPPPIMKKINNLIWTDPDEQVEYKMRFNRLYNKTK